MQKEEIQFHQGMKSKNPLYPQLPKSVLGTKVSTQGNKGLIDSTVRGFRSRVMNWEKAEEIRLSNLI